MNLLAYTHLNRLRESTGVGRVMRQMTEHLAARSGVNLRVLGSRREYAELIPNVGEPWTSYSYALFDTNTSWQQKIWYLLRSPCAEEYWSEVDLVYCTAESYVPTHQARTAVTVHDAAAFERNGLAHPNTWKQRFKWLLLYRRLKSTTDLFHTVSEFSAERIAHFFPEIRDRLCVVYNAVAPHFFEPTAETGREYLSDEGLKDRPFILLPRGLHYRKGADVILEAWPQIQEVYPELLLVVTSHNDPQYLREARKLRNVRIEGFVSDTALHALYGAAALVWMPSRYEGFGLPVLESMARGTPVVASNISALPEVAGDAALLVPPTNIGQHVAAVDALLHDRTLRESLEQAGEDRARKFTWERAADELYDNFQQLI